MFDQGRGFERGEGREFVIPLWHFFNIHVIDIQSTIVISTSVISNNRLSRRENLIPV